MGLIPISIAFLLTLASIESSYYYYSSPNHYYPAYASAVPSSYVQPPYAYFAPRLSRPIYYVRPLSRSVSRPVRKFARSYKVSSQLLGAETAPTIILNETAIPFTVNKSALSTAEFEKNPDQPAEEGVGPAVEVTAPAPAPRLPVNSKVPSIASKGATGKEKSKGKGKFGQKRPSFEPEVVYSDVHPIYVKPPIDFRPVLYPNRRLDGVRATSQLTNQVILPSPSPPFPFPYPHGVSSWTLGGPKAVSRGNYWESLSSDEALNLQPEANTIHPSTSLATGAANFNGKAKLNPSQRPMPMPSYLPWFMVPAASSLYSYEMQYPAHPSSSITIMPLGHPRLSSDSRRAKPASGSSSSKKEKKPIPATKEKSKSESSEGIRTKLPVGLSSWMLGGVRDLTGKHWKMPDLFVDNVAVVEMDNSTSESKNKESDAGKDTMMTSDGDYEKVVPVVSVPVPEGEREEKEEDAPRESGVVFDDDPEFLSANNNINLS